MFVVRCLVWALRIMLFILLLGFAIKNDNVIDVHFFLHTVWQVPLILIMLTFFALGVILGGSVSIIPLLKQLRKERTARRMEDHSAREPQAPLMHPRRKQDQLGI